MWRWESSNHRYEQIFVMESKTKSGIEEANPVHSFAAAS